MKSVSKQASAMLERMNLKNNKGQLEVGKTFVVGLVALIFLIVFALVFQSQIFTAVPLTAGTAEANESAPIRSNGSRALGTIASNFGTWASIIAFAIIVIILVFAYKVFMRGNSDMAGGTGSY